MMVHVMACDLIRWMINELVSRLLYKTWLSSNQEHNFAHGGSTLNLNAGHTYMSLPSANLSIYSSTIF